MSVDVLITARVRIDREAFKNCSFPSRDVSLDAVAYVLRELPAGMTYLERTARLVAISREDGSKP